MNEIPVNNTFLYKKNKMKFFCYILVVMQIVSLNTYSSQDQKKSINSYHLKKPNNGINLFFEYLTANGFDSKKYGVNGHFSLFRSDQTQCMLNFNFDHRLIDFSNTHNHYFPDNVYTITTDMQFRRDRFLIRCKFGSRSDKPFNSFDELQYMALAGYNILNSQKHFLYLSVLTISRLSVLPDNVDDYPLPFLVYLFQSKNLQIMAPFPISIKWRINKKFSMILYNQLISKFNLILKYHITPDFDISLEGYIQKEQILVADREDRKETLTLNSSKTGLGLSYYFIQAFFGYSFNQKYQIQKQDGFFKSAKKDKMSLNNSLIFNLGINFKF